MKNKIIFYLYSLLIGGLLCLTACQDDHPVPQQNIDTYKVAIVLPASGNAFWQRTVDLAISHLDQAQATLDNAVHLDIEWHDEDAEDMESYIETVASDDAYVAMIGPLRSKNARRAAELFNAATVKKPLLLPAATSTEFQRIFSEKDFVWNLTESDLTQCEMLVTQAVLSEMYYVSLIASDSDYGRSFSDWIAFQATEMGIKIKDILTYSDEKQLREAVRQIASSNSYSTQLIFAPDRSSDLLVLDDEFAQLLQANPRLSMPTIMCSDVLNSMELIGRNLHFNYEGLAPSADPLCGFINAYHARFGTEPINGEAQLYDAIMMLYYGVTAQQSSDNRLNDTLLDILNAGGDSHNGWFPADINPIFIALAAGHRPALSGVTGDWTFDDRSRTTILNTIYGHWVLKKGNYATIEYLSTDGGRRTTSTLQAWDMQSSVFQQFDASQADYDYGPLTGHRAVIIGTSDTWANYRHQADALAMYQCLKRHGYTDDDIIFIIEDNLADHPQNLHPGEIRVRLDGENLYHDVIVDYKLSDITIHDFGNILQGEKSDKCPTVLESGIGDNVFVYWCGHGNSNQLAWGSKESVSSIDIRKILSSMSEEKKFRKLLFSMDACYSGTLGETCTGIPGVLFITAANSYEPSKADVKDPDMGIFLSNGFTRQFQETIDEAPDISLRDLYYRLAQHTTGSHVTLYNTQHYGNIYHSYMKEFLHFSAE